MLFRSITLLQQVTDVIAAKPAHLFAPREAIRYRYRAGFGGAESERGASAEVPQYPPAGAMIDYWLATPALDARLEILDARGSVIQGYGVDTVRSTTTRGGAPAGLSARAGLNRFVWDMTYPGPWNAAPAQGGRVGPMAAPGTYTVRLTANGTTMTQSLLLRADPRVTHDGMSPSVLNAQLAFNLKVRDLVSDANRVAERLRAAPNAALDAEFFTPPVRYSRPALQAHITYLYSENIGADQRVGRDAMDRYAELRKALDALTARISAAPAR